MAQVIRKAVSGFWLLAMLAVLQAHGIAQQQRGGTPPGTYVEGELLVKFQAGASPQRPRMANAQVGARMIRDFAPLHWQHVRLPKGMSVSEGLARYRKLPGVLAAQPNYTYKLVATPNDPRYGELYGMTKIGAPTAWDTITGSSNVVVAVIDTGVDYNHEDLRANMWHNPGEIPGNGVDDDGNGYVDDFYGIDPRNGDADPMDDYSHGTHVAGTIGAVGNNAKGVVGVNWSVQIMALKLHDSAGNGTAAAAVECFQYVTMMKNRGVNIRVTSNSWAGAPEAPAYDQALKDAIDAAGNAGVLHVFAAGNDNRDIDPAPLYPASYDSPSIIAVAASDSSDNRASFSNYGTTSVDLAAPGVSILSTVPGSAYGYKSGTSMATPHVSGAAALLAAYDSSLSVASLKATLMNAVDVLPQWSGKVVTGGRLNLARALQSRTVCTYSLSAVNQSFSASGGSGSVNVIAPSACEWAAVSNANFITITAGAKGTSNGAVSYSIALYSGTTPRTGTITIAGQTFTVTQAPPPSLSFFSDVFVSEPSSGTATALFFVVLSSQTDQTVTVNFATADGTANAGSDYVANSGTLTFNPGETSRALQVTVNSDALVEGNETFFVNLTAPSNATIADAQGVGTITPLVLPGAVIISEFRFRGPDLNELESAANEFIELYNNTDAPITVSTSDTSSGWLVSRLTSSSLGTLTVDIIPNGTIIPARGHYLLVNATGYSLNAYATGDRFYTANIEDDTGIALFRSANSANLTNRLDAVGFNKYSGTMADLHREGAGLPQIGAANQEISFVRRMTRGVPQDTNDNAADFVFVSTMASGSQPGAGPVLGSPGPENSRSPINRNIQIRASLVDPLQGAAHPNNRFRNSGAAGPNAPLGTLSIRRTYTNNTGASITRLRFRVVDITTLNSAGYTACPDPRSCGQADLRLLSSTDITVTRTDGVPVTARGTTLEEPPIQADFEGGGLNSSLSVGTITTGTPLAPGATISVQFLLGIQQVGTFSFFVNVEALP